MSELFRTEYQVFTTFTNLTKNVLSDSLSKLNQNTVAAVMQSLLDKGYLEIAEMKYFQNVLAKDYRTSIPFKDLLKEEYGEYIFLPEKLIIV